MHRKVGLFTFATGVPTQAVALGFRPKAIIFWSVGAVANNSAGALAQPAYGFWADCGQEGPRTRSRFYYRSAAVGSGINSHKDFLGSIGSYTGMIRSRSYGFTIDSVSSTGFTITWSPTPPNGTIYHYLAIGGDEVEAYINATSLTIPGSAASGTVYQVSSVPFRPTAVMAIGSHGQVGASVGADISLGFLDEANGQFAYANSIGVASGPNGASSSTYRNNCIVAGTQTEMRLQGVIKQDGLTLTGFEGAGNASARSLEVDFLFLGNVHSKASFVQIPATNVLQNIAVGFKPVVALNVGWHLGLQSAGDTPESPNIFYLGGSAMMGAGDLITGDTGTVLLNYTQAANGNSGADRNDLFWAATQTSYADTNPVNFVRWISTIGASGGNVQLTYAGGNTKQGYLGLFTLGEMNRLEGTIDFTSTFEAPLDLKGNHPLNGSIEAAMAFDTTQLGGLGNLDAQPMDMQFSLQTPGIGFTRPLEGVIESTSDLISPGVGFTRPLEGLIDAAFTIEAPKIGREWSNTGSIDAAFSLEVPGIGFSRPLTGIIPIVSDLNGYFILDMPTVRPPTRDDLIGTVNLVLNPSVELGLLGWRGVGVTPTQSQESAWDKSYSAKYVLTAAGEGFAVESITGLELTGWARDPISGAEIEGTPRRMPSQVRLRVAGSPTPFTLTTLATYQDLTTDESDPLDVTVTGDWKAYYPPTVDLDPDKRLIKLEIVGVAASACTLYADGAQIEEDRGQGPTSWVTGAYGRESGVWTGGPNQSMSVRQPIPMIVRGIGRGGAATIKGTMYRVTQDNVILDDISDLVIEARASMDVSRRSTWQLDCTMSTRAWEYMRPNEDWLAPWLRIEYPNGEVKEGQLGLYFVTPSSMTRGEFGGKVSVFAGDPLWLLDREEFVGSQAFPALTDHSEAIRQMIAGGIMPDGSGFKRFYIPDSGIQMAQAFEWEDGTSRLAGSLELCEGGAMYPLWTDPTGFITTKRMGSWRLRDQTPVKGYLAHIPDGVVVDPWIPRVAALKSEVVGEVSVTPKAQDYVDRILVTSADPRLATPIETQAMLVYADAPIEGLVDSMDDPSNPVVYQEWWRRNQARGRDGRRRQGNRQGRRRMKSLPYVGVGRSQTLPSRLITSPVAAKELAATLVDNLSSQVERVGFSVFPDPSIDYAHATVVCNIWDAFEDAVAVGQYVVNRVNFGFTPKTAMQTMELSWVDPNESEIVLR